MHDGDWASILVPFVIINGEKGTGKGIAAFANCAKWLSTPDGVRTGDIPATFRNTPLFFRIGITQRNDLDMISCHQCFNMTLALAMNAKNCSPNAIIGSKDCLRSIGPTTAAAAADVERCTKALRVIDFFLCFTAHLSILGFKKNRNSNVLFATISNWGAQMLTPRG